MLPAFLSASAYDFEVDGIYYDIVFLPNLTCAVTCGDKYYEGDITVPSEVLFKGRTLSIISIGFTNNIFQMWYMYPKKH